MSVLIYKRAAQRMKDPMSQTGKNKISIFPINAPNEI